MLACRYLGFFSLISDVTTKLKRCIAFSLSPSFPRPPEVVDVTLVLVFFYVPLDRDLNTIPIFFSGLADIQSHKNLISFFLAAEGVVGVILCPGHDHFP